MRHVLQRAAARLRAFAGKPVRPYAALWEASVVVNLLQEPKTLEPDPLETETPFRGEAWLLR